MPTYLPGLTWHKHMDEVFHIDIAPIYVILEKYGLARELEDTQHIATSLWLAVGHFRYSDEERLKMAQKPKAILEHIWKTRRDLVYRLSKDQGVLNVLGISDKKIEAYLCDLDNQINSRRSRTGPLEIVKHTLSLAYQLMAKKGIDRYNRKCLVHDVLIAMKVHGYGGLNVERELSRVSKWDPVTEE
ncbi:hypothetical protein ACFLZR_00715 [Candidatus Neomarinimicrobiota bacterium]